MLIRRKAANVCKLFRTFRNLYITHIVTNKSFPSYIDAVNWGDRFQVIEVYMTLQRVSESEQGLPVAVS